MIALLDTWSSLRGEGKKFDHLQGSVSKFIKVWEESRTTQEEGAKHYELHLSPVHFAHHGQARGRKLFVPVFFFRSFSSILGFQTGLTAELMLSYCCRLLCDLWLKVATLTHCISREVHQTSPWFLSTRHVSAGKAVQTSASRAMLLLALNIHVLFCLRKGWGSVAA